MPAMALYADSHQQLLKALSAIGREIQVIHWRWHSNANVAF
jgi:hypothetical protein